MKSDTETGVGVEIRLFRPNLVTLYSCYCHVGQKLLGQGVHGTIIPDSNRDALRVETERIRYFSRRMA